MSPYNLDAPLVPEEQVKVLSKIKRAAVSSKLNFSDVASFVGHQLTSHPSRSEAAAPLNAIAARGHIAAKQLNEAQMKLPSRTTSAATTAYTSGQSFASRPMPPSRNEPSSPLARSSQGAGAGRFSRQDSQPPQSSPPIPQRSQSATGLEPPEEVSMAKAHSLRQRLDWLHTERRMRRERLRTVDNLISEETLEQRRMALKVEKHKAEQQFHYEKVWDLERQISEVRGDLHRALPRGMVRSYSEGFARKTKAPVKAMARSDGFKGSSGLKSNSGAADQDDFLEDDQKVSELPKVHSGASGSAQDYDPRANKPSGPMSLSGVDSLASASGRLTHGNEELIDGSGSRPSTTEGLHELQNVSANISQEMDRLCSRLETLEDRHMLSAEDRDMEELMYALECDETFEKEDDLMPLIVSACDATSEFSDAEADEMGRTSAKRTSYAKGRRGTDFDRNRDLIRMKMIEACGSEFGAYKSLDSNLNGEVSITEFVDGLERLKVPWRQVTGFKTRGELFKLFDVDASGSLDLREIFPEEAARQAAPKRVSTPEFWHHWVKGNRNCCGKSRPAMWVNNVEASLSELMTSQKVTDRIVWKRKWMKDTMRRLKGNGKSDARCRELTAQHLPRGTGPKDSQGVGTFCTADVRSCHRNYFEKIQRPVRKIQKVVYDLRAQRRELHDSRHKFWQITEAVQRQKADEERKKRLAEGIMLGGTAADEGTSSRNTKAHFDKIRGDTEQEKEHFEVDESQLSELERLHRGLSRKYGIPVNDIEYMHQKFKNFDVDGSGYMKKPEFSSLLGKLLNAPVSGSELALRWSEVCKMKMNGVELPETRGSGEDEAINFERFLVWFWVLTTQS